MTISLKGNFLTLNMVHLYTQFRISLIIIFAVCGLNPLCAQWEEVKTPGTSGLRSLAQIGNSFFAAGDEEIFRSDDNGWTWSKINTPFIGYLGDEIRLIRAYNGQLFVLLKNNSPLQLWKSSDAGANWEQCSLPSISSVVVQPDLVFSNENIFVRGTQGGIWRIAINELPSGNWVQILGGADALHADGSILWAYTGGLGIARSLDYGSTWNTVTYEVSDVTGFAINGDTVIAVQEIGSARSIDNGQNWENIGFSISEVYKKVVYLDGLWYALNDYAGEYGIYVSDDAFFNRDWLTKVNILEDEKSLVRVGGLMLAPGLEGCLQSGDFGKSWRLIGSGFNDANGTRTIQRIGNFLALFDEYFPYFDSNHLLWLSADNGSSWYLPGANIDLAQVNHIPFEKNGIYYAAIDNHVYRSFDKMQNWERADQNGLPPDPNGTPADQIRGIFADDQYLYAYLIEWAGGAINLFRSSDNGNNWGLVTPLSFLPVKTVFFNQKLFSCNDEGQIWVSVDQGMSWEMRANFPGQLNYGKFFCIDQGILYFYSRNTIMRCNDGEGYEWTPLNQNLLNPQGGQSVISSFWADEGVFFAVGDYSSATLMSADSGATWAALLSNPTISGFCSDVFVNEGFVWVASDQNRLWRRPLDDLLLNRISGIAYLDANYNLTQDTNEVGIPGVLLRGTGNVNWTSTNLAGQYNIYAAIDGDTIFPISPFAPGVANIFPPYFVAADSFSAVPFAIQINPDVKDFSTNIVNTLPFRPGFETDIVVGVGNHGANNPSGILKVWLDPELEVLDIFPLPDLTIGDSLVWQLTDIPALFGTKTFVLKVRTVISAPLGSIVRIGSQVSPITDDILPGDNFVLLEQPVVGSFDPNDKNVYPNSYTTAAVANGDRLYYTIRFQNTGSYPASFVRIADTLDLQLDISTFRRESSSHPMQWSLRDGNALEFYFPDIYLPDSASNEAESHGWVQFSIAGKKSLTVGDKVENTAHIYFDYNDPIMTNMVESSVQQANSVLSHLQVLPLVILPNPAEHHILIDIPEEVPLSVAQLSIFDENGRTVWNQTGLQPRTIIQTGNLPTGVFRVKIRVPNGFYTGSFIKVKM